MNIAHWSNFDTVMWSIKETRRRKYMSASAPTLTWQSQVSQKKKKKKRQWAWLFALFWPKSVHQGNWPADLTDMQSMPCHMEQLQMDHDLIIYHGHLTKFCVLRPVKSKWISYRSCTADGYFPPFRQYFITTTALPEFTTHVISNIKLFACFGHGSWQSSSSAKSWICWTNKWWHKRYVQWWTSGTYGAVFGSRWRMVPGKNEKEKKHHSARTLPYCSCSYNMECLVGEPVHLLPHWQPF